MVIYFLRKVFKIETIKKCLLCLIILKKEMEDYLSDFLTFTQEIINGYLPHHRQTPYFRVKKSLKPKNGATLKDSSNHLKILLLDLCFKIT